MKLASQLWSFTQAVYYHFKQKPLGKQFLNSQYGIIIITTSEFLTSQLSDGLSLKFEWQQVSSSLQDSFQYSGHSQ